MSAEITNGDDLRARIREIALTEPDPARITERILRSLTAPEFRVVATVALHDFVRRAIQNGVCAATPARTYETPTGGRTPSPKVAALRDWLERQLLRPLCVDEAARSWKHLGDCTADDLLVAAAIRRRKAAETLDEAERYEDVAKAVEHAGVATVRELPRDVLEGLLRR